MKAIFCFHQQKGGQHAFQAEFQEIILSNGREVQGEAIRATASNICFKSSGRSVLPLYNLLFSQRRDETAYLKPRASL